MNLTIYEFFNPSTKMSLYVNDRMSMEDEKNRIIFEIAKLNEFGKKTYSVVYFMDIPEAKLLCYKILKDKFFPGEAYHKVRGKHGSARAITLNRTDKGLNIKIDNGTGRERENSFTEFNKKTGFGYTELDEDEMYKLFLCIQDRILQREMCFMNEMMNRKY